MVSVEIDSTLHKPIKRSRDKRSLLLLVALAIVLALCASFLIAVQTNWEEKPAEYACKLLDNGETLWTMTRVESLGAVRRYSWRQATFRADEVQLMSLQSSGTLQDPYALRSSWLNFQDRPVRISQHDMRVEDTFGFPLKCIRCSFEIPVSPHAISSADWWKQPLVYGQPIIKNGILIHPDTYPQLSARVFVVLPLEVMPLRFAINCGAWLAALILSLLVVRTIRCYIRLGRGHCPKCSYALYEGLRFGCSECGWRR